jgi:cytochrome oxidase assembly protein ShyY1
MATHPFGAAIFDHVFLRLTGLPSSCFRKVRGLWSLATDGDRGPGRAAGALEIQAITLGRMRTLRSAVNSTLWTVAALLLVVAFILLGRWQWQRTYRPIDGYSAEPAATPLETLIPAGSAVPATALARQVTVSGSYVVTGQEIVPGHSLGGQDVSWVVTPLAMSDNREVLVVRGWVGAGGAALAAPPTSPVSVTGRVETGNVLSIRTPPTANAVPAGYLIRTAQSPPDPLSLQPVPAAPPHDHAQQEFHLQNAIYVVQWYLLAIIAVVAWWRFLRASRRPQTADGQRPLEPAV